MAFIKKALLQWEPHVYILCYTHFEMILETFLVVEDWRYNCSDNKVVETTNDGTPEPQGGEFRDLLEGSIRTSKTSCV